MILSNRKFIGGVLFLFAALFFYLSNTFFPTIFVGFGLIFITIGIFEYKEYSNRSAYWILISLVLIFSLGLEYYSSPHSENEWLYYSLMGILFIIFAWYSFRPKVQIQV